MGWHTFSFVTPFGLFYYSLLCSLFIAEYTMKAVENSGFIMSIVTQTRMHSRRLLLIVPCALLFTICFLFLGFGQSIRSPFHTSADINPSLTGGSLDHISNKTLGVSRNQGLLVSLLMSYSFKRYSLSTSRLEPTIETPYRWPRISQTYMSSM